MKSNKSLFILFGIMVLLASLYRVWDDRPLGFAPQIAIAVFAGAVIKDKLWAFIIPLLSMFISDALYHVLYINGLTDRVGFYEGQWQNYLLFALLTTVGFIIKKINVVNILTASLVAPTIYFIFSNFIVWAGWQGTRGFGRPKTFEGLLQAFADGLPFYRGSLIATVLFSAILFGSYFLIKKYSTQSRHQLA